MLACVMEPCTKAHAIIKKMIQFTVGLMDSNSLDSLFEPHPQAWSCNHPEAVGTSDDLSFVKSVNCITCCNNWMLNVGLCHGIMHQSTLNYYNKWYNVLLGTWVQKEKGACFCVSFLKGILKVLLSFLKGSLKGKYKEIVVVSHVLSF